MRMGQRGFSIPTHSRSKAASPDAVATKTMKRLLVLSLLIAPTVFAAETHRYIIATSKPARVSRLHVLNTPVEAAERHVRAFESIDGFAVDLTDAEAAEMQRTAGVRYVGRTVDIHAVGDVRTTFVP